MKTTETIILDYEKKGASMKQMWFSEKEYKSLFTKLQKMTDYINA